MSADSQEEVVDDNNICANCRTKVFWNERAPPFLTRTYHSHCFKCESCKRILYAGGFMDHSDEPYCECCYERLFAGNRRMYSAPDRPAIGEIDTSDPLKEMKSHKKLGKLDIERFSLKHNIPNTIKQSQSKSYKHNAKLHRYMLGGGNANESIVLKGRMKYVHSRVRERVQKMIIHHCYALQTKLMQRVDDILQTEMLRDFSIAEMNNVSTDSDEIVQSHKKDLNEIRNTLETHIKIPTNFVMNTSTETNEKSAIMEDNESDLDTQELIARLTANKLV